MSVAFDQQATAGRTPASHTLVICATNSAVDERRKTSLHVTRSYNSLLTRYLLIMCMKTIRIV